MNCSLVQVKTRDRIVLHGLLWEASQKKTVVINIHGTASSFYDEDFMPVMGEKFSQQGISFLSTNNRGTMVLQARPLLGAATESFEDCVKDIDAWISFARVRNYQHIFLQGHSLGTEKIVYYLNKGQHKDLVKGVILLGFSDSYGSQMKYLQKKKLSSKLIAEAYQLVSRRKWHTFLTSHWQSHAGVFPRSASAYINAFKHNSELSKALPLHQGKNLAFYKKISVPILAIIGDKKEYTIIPIQQALSLLKKENPLTETHQIKNCNHDFEGKEQELTRLVRLWLQRHRV